jgi:acetyl esterase/lipase
MNQYRADLLHGQAPHKAGTSARQRERIVARMAISAMTLMSLARCAPVDVLNATVPTAGLVVTRDIPYGGLPREKLDIYRPADAAGLPVVVFIYGGSWRSGSKAMYPFVAATMARAGAVVVVPDYRLYPQVTYPAFLTDCALAVAWANANRSTVGSSGPLFLMGHSAGAYNAVMLGLDTAWLADTGREPPPLAGVIGLAGPYDFLPITDPEVKPVFPDPSPATQPITYAAAGRPPLLLLTGSDDTQVKPRNSAALASKLERLGGSVQTVVYPGLGHIGLVTAIAPIFQWRAPVLRDVMDFIRAHTPSQPGHAVPKPAHTTT